MSDKKAPELLYVIGRTIENFFTAHEGTLDTEGIEYILKSKADAEKEELIKYAKHNVSCARWGNKILCTCGLDEILSKQS